MAKLEKIAIQTTLVTCQNSLCKAIFTAEINEFFYNGGRNDEENKFHKEYVIYCPNCTRRCFVEDPEFTIRYVTPAQLRKEKRLEKVLKFKKGFVSFFKELKHIFYTLLGI